jgi:hypothetical protein
MARSKPIVLMKWIWLMFLGISLLPFSHVLAQNDSVVVGVYFSSSNSPVQYTSPNYFKSTFNAVSQIASFKTGQNPISYLPGTNSIYSYDAQGRLIIKDSLKMDAFGGSVLAAHESYKYNAFGSLTNHMFAFQGWSDSSVYLKDKFLRDSINTRYINSLLYPKLKSEYFYQGSYLLPNQIVESSFDSILNVWIPNVLHKCYYTSFDSLEIDTSLKYNNITHQWDPWKVTVNSYAVNHCLSSSQDYIFLNGFYTLNNCRNYFYNSSSKLVKFDEYAGSCGGYLMYHYEWSYNASGDLMSYLGMQNLSSLNCGWFTLSNYQYIRDSLGKVVEVDLTDNQPGVPCSGSSYKREFYYAYAEKGKWSIELIVPESSVTHCEDDESIAYLLALNEPFDAISYWKVNDSLSGSGIVKTLSLKENLIVSAYATSISLNDTVFSSEVHFKVLGKSSLPIFSNGSSDDVKKCDETIVVLLADSVKLKNPSWYLNGNALNSLNGNFSIPVNQQGTYSCRSIYIASPNCLHEVKIAVENDSPHPKLVSAGSNIANLLTVISDDSFKLGSSYDWYKNGSYLFSTYDGNLNVSSPGTYYCNVTNQRGCENSSANLVVDLYKSTSDNVGVWFANPVVGNQFTIAFDLSIWPLNEDIRYSVYDLQGRLIVQNNLSSQNETILLPHGSGEYFISFYKGNQMKLVKKLLVIDQ